MTSARVLGLPSFAAGLALCAAASLGLGTSSARADATPTSGVVCAYVQGSTTDGRGNATFGVREEEDAASAPEAASAASATEAASAPVPADAARKATDKLLANARRFHLCPPDKAPGETLSPDGASVVVVIGATDLAAAAKPAAKPWVLSLNGVPLDTASTFAATLVRADLVALRFDVRQTDADAKFWDSVFRHGAFYKPWKPLDIAVGWEGNYTRFVLDAASGDGVVLTTTTRLVLGILASLAIFFWLCERMQGSDWFRIGPHVGGQGAQAKTVISRQAYSLAKVQWGVWFTFTLIASVFLLIVHGSLPKLNETMLTLVAISTLTTTASFFNDAKNPPIPTISDGLWNDIISGNNGDAQLHRYQAIIVNLLMLGVAAIAVGDNLAFPVFDNTWLAFLGLSNAAQQAGKAMVENQPTHPVVGATGQTLADASQLGKAAQTAATSAQAASTAASALVGSLVAGNPVSQAAVDQAKIAATTAADAAFAAGTATQQAVAVKESAQKAADSVARPRP